jgi:hypothetical protein
VRIQLLAIACAVASFIIIYVVAGTDSGPELFTAHRALGIIAVALAVLQVGAAMRGGRAHHHIWLQAAGAASLAQGVATFVLSQWMLRPTCLPPHLWNSWCHCHTQLQATGTATAAQDVVLDNSAIAPHAMCPFF